MAIQSFTNTFNMFASPSSSIFTLTHNHNVSADISILWLIPVALGVFSSAGFAYWYFVVHLPSVAALANNAANAANAVNAANAANLANGGANAGAIVNVGANAVTDGAVAIMTPFYIPGIEYTGLQYILPAFMLRRVVSNVADNAASVVVNHTHNVAPAVVDHTHNAAPTFVNNIYTIAAPVHDVMLQFVYYIADCIALIRLFLLDLYFWLTREAMGVEPSNGGNPPEGGNPPGGGGNPGDGKIISQVRQGSTETVIQHPNSGNSGQGNPGHEKGNQGNSVLPDDSVEAIAQSPSEVQEHLISVPVLWALVFFLVGMFFVIVFVVKRKEYKHPRTLALFSFIMSWSGIFLVVIGSILFPPLGSLYGGLSSVIRETVCLFACISSFGVIVTLIVSAWRIFSMFLIGDKIDWSYWFSVYLTVYMFSLLPLLVFGIVHHNYQLW